MDTWQAGLRQAVLTFSWDGETAGEQRLEAGRQTGMEDLGPCAHLGQAIGGDKEEERAR